MAVRASREIVIDAPPGVILEALADVGALTSWSPVHKRIQVLDWYADGRPHHVKATIKIFGLVDKHILEYHWGRFDITVEPTGPVPGFVVRRASEIVLDAATNGLRDQVMAGLGPERPK